jgi:murein L,D-transpeptidase YafK
MTHQHAALWAPRIVRAAVAALLAGSLAACQEAQTLEDARAYHPIPPATLDLMAKAGATEVSPVLIRTFKKEAEFEVWKKGADGRYAYIKTFPMCRWSGQLGPKIREGDRQVPEGFYAIGPGQMNPNSHYYLSFNVGYPNAYDKAHGDTGGDIMVHGICSSAGCFSMTDQQMDEIYAIAREAFAGGQRDIQLESFPFRMTAENMAKFRLDPNMPFWKELKQGYDFFDLTHEEPQVAVCGKRYVFDKVAATPGSSLEPTLPCPGLKDEDPRTAALVKAKERQDDLQVAELVAKGTPAVRLVYQDGGQNAEFANKITEESRPDALAQGPTEIVLADPVKGGKRKVRDAPAVAVASAASASRKTRTAAAALAKTASRVSSTRISEALPSSSPSPASTPSQANALALQAGPTANARFYSRWLSLVSDRLAVKRQTQDAAAAQ